MRIYVHLDFFILLGMDSSDDKIEPTYIRQPSLELLGHSSVVIAADWISGGNQVITASWDRMAHLYDSETGEIITGLSGILFRLLGFDLPIVSILSWLIFRTWPRADQRLFTSISEISCHLIQGHDIQTMGLAWSFYEGQCVSRSYTVCIFSCRRNEGDSWCIDYVHWFVLMYPFQAGDISCVWQWGLGRFR